MNKHTRNRLQRATQAARALIEREYGEQLEGTFDLRLDGTIPSEPGVHLNAHQRALWKKLVAAIGHVEAGGEKSREAVQAYRREAAFTTLNRFVAIKMLEARGLVLESVSQGDQSSGFKEFTGLAPGLVQLPDHGYRLYIESLFDEIGREVRVLFDSRDPASLLWPRRQALHDLLEILNAPELASVWIEDETIGWVYQYFNGEDERRAMREASQAPRDSRELAVRNQFFTPRYVVQFLVDNTLGRTWFEMMRGETSLKGLDYLFRRQHEVFLAEGEAVPEEPDGISLGESQEHPFPVSFRSKRDPRDLKILDPACGSGHFLLYTFDLLLTVYEEAWQDAGAAPSEMSGTTLRADHPELEALRTAAPGLILRHNLHGIDIDSRAAQIAALALWLRAQRAFQEGELSRTQRPAVAKTNIVVAEPMPGEVDLRRAFVATLETKLGKLVEYVFERMSFAGEAGYLLRINAVIEESIRQIYGGVGGLYEAAEKSEWSQAVEDVRAALETFVTQASADQSYARQLFAGDAARGLGFVDVCSQTYDFILMNPPFGDATDGMKSAVGAGLKASGSDIGAAFVLEASELLAPGGSIGCLLSTGPWFKPTFERWREDLFLGKRTSLRVAAHLAGEVLDGATVSASPFVLFRDDHASFTAIRLTRVEDLEAQLLAAIASFRSGDTHKLVFTGTPAEAAFLPGRPFCYWVSNSLRSRLLSLPKFEGTGGEVRTGLQTSDEPRFSRAWWEIDSADPRWIPYAKSSPYAPFWDDYTWVQLIGDDLREVSAFSKSKVQGIDYFGRPGVTYPSKSVLGFNARLHPSGCGFAHSGCVAFPSDAGPLALLSVLSSRPVEYLISLFLGELQGRAGVHPNQYEVGILQRLPWPSFTDNALDSLEDQGARAVASAKRLDQHDETAHSFCGPLLDDGAGFDANLELLSELELSVVRGLASLRERADEIVFDAYGFSQADREFVEEAFEERVPPAKGRWRVYFGGSGTDLDRGSFAHRLVSWLLGIALGRWRTGHLRNEIEEDHDALLLIPPAPPLARNPGETPSALVDDPGHASDVCASLEKSVADSRWIAGQDGLGHCWGTQANGLRSYLARGFFDEHRKRYSKSKRKAPIYWQLATPSASYSAWLYYHGLTRDTLFRLLNEHVAPKLRHEERKLTDFTQEAGPNPAASQRKEIDSQETFVGELRAFRDEVALVAPMWNPNLNDGVILNFAPLWRLVPQHKAWQKECKSAWDKLCEGDYDWAHLAMHLWPERVVPKCAKDRSLAIAHGLEEVFWREGEDGKWQLKIVSDEEVEALAAERTSPAVKAALKSLLEAPAPASVRRRAPRRKKATTRRAKATRSSSVAAPPPEPSSAQATAARTLDQAVLDQVRSAIATLGGNAAKSDILATAGLSASQWSPVINALLADGSVTKTGQKRGTRYHLAQDPS